MLSRGEFFAGLLSSAVAQVLPAPTRPPAFRDTTLSLSARVDDLIGRMTVREKISQLTNSSAAIDRLGVPGYNWWNEALHGVARNGVATVFPQAIGMAATWDAPLIERIGDVISTEGRAKYTADAARDRRGRYHGLTFWSPNINMVRDPRWGRAQETYGEDPFLTATLGIHFVRGVQGNDPHYLKAAACAKHFAVHSGPEPLRDSFNVDIDDRSLHEYYLPAFRALVTQARVAGVMSAYSSLDGRPCSVNTMLLQTTLRDAWKFDGYVTSDCGAVDDLVETYRVATDYAHAAAMAIEAGVDVSCGDAFSYLNKAAAEGIVTMSAIDSALRHLLAIRFRLGMFDPPEEVPYTSITLAQNDTPEHAALALEAARESIVLLKNSGGLLPLHDPVHRIAVIGPNADELAVMLGNYNGTPSSNQSIVQAVRAAAPTALVRYARGCDYVAPGEANEREAALALARDSDVVIFVGGISPALEGEAMKVDLEGFAGGDRTRIELPEVQEGLLRALHATGTPVVFVQLCGSSMACGFAREQIPAIVQAWYPGEAGAAAIADVLFGRYNPAGRLPVTFYAATSDLPPFEDYNLPGRTYRYASAKPAHVFGHGLSYTSFEYSRRRMDAGGDSLLVSFDVTNTGRYDGDEVVQCYVRSAQPVLGDPVRQLCAFERVHVRRGATMPIALDVPYERFAKWTGDNYAVRSGAYILEVGASSADIRFTERFVVDGSSD